MRDDTAELCGIAMRLERRGLSVSRCGNGAGGAIGRERKVVEGGSLLVTPRLRSSSGREGVRAAVGYLIPAMMWYTSRPTMLKKVRADPTANYLDG